MSGIEPAPVAIIVLAAGASTRMGKNKLLLELGGETLVRGAVTRALGARTGPVIVVVGYEAERIGAELAHLPCEIARNPAYAEGQRTSLQAGLARVPEGVSAVAVLLPDMAYVTRAMLEAVIERYRESHAPLVVSRYGEVTAPPVVYDRSLFGELRDLRGSQCAKSVVRKHRHEALEVIWPESALLDIDRAEDYERVCAERAKPSGE